MTKSWKKLLIKQDLIICCISLQVSIVCASYIIWATSSEFVSSSIPSWQTLTAHAQPFKGARELAFCLKAPLDSLPVWASSGGSGETARMRRLAWTFAARIGDKYQTRLTRSNYTFQIVCISLYWDFQNRILDFLVKLIVIYKCFSNLKSCSLICRTESVMKR